MRNGIELRNRSVRLCGYLCCALLPFGALPAYADTTGPLTPTGVTTGPSPFGPGTAWVSPGLSIGSDDSRATCPGVLSAALIFSFSPGIPAGATLDGIEVFVEGFGSGAPNQIAGSQISLDSGATFTFPAGFKSASLTTGTDTIVTLGGPADTWGGITTANVNSAVFRVGVVLADLIGMGPGGYACDDVRMTVTYTPAIPVELSTFKVSRARDYQHTVRISPKGTIAFPPGARSSSMWIVDRQDRTNWFVIDRTKPIQAPVLDTKHAESSRSNK